MSLSINKLPLLVHRLLKIWIFDGFFFQQVNWSFENILKGKFKVKIIVCIVFNADWCKIYNQIYIAFFTKFFC